MIRIEFKRRKEEITRRGYKPNPRHDKWDNWLQAADNCIKIGADPLRFVEACFSACTLPSGPFANQLGGPGAERWFYSVYPSKFNRVEENSNEFSTADDKETLFAADDMVNYELKAAIILLIRLSGTKNQAYWQPFLVNTMTPISAHIRIALGYWMPDVAKLYGDEALGVLTVNPELFRALRNAGCDLTEFIKLYGTNSKSRHRN